MGIKSLIGRPKMDWAGNSFVARSGVFLYWRMARCRGLVSRSPLRPVFVMSRLTDLMPTSARQFECG